MNDYSSAHRQPLCRWGVLTQKPKLLGTAAFVQISILTVLFNQKRSYYKTELTL